MKVIKNKWQLDSAAIANEVDSRVMAHVMAVAGERFDLVGPGDIIDHDDLSNIVNAIVKEVMDELENNNGEL